MHRDSGYAMVLICHVIAEDHEIKRSYDFICSSPSRYFTILPSLVAICTLGTLYGWEPFVLNHHPGKFAGHRHCGSRDINIPANTLILPQIRDIRYRIWPLTFAIIIFCKAHDMSCATRASNNNVRNNFYWNIF